MATLNTSGLVKNMVECFSLVKESDIVTLQETNLTNEALKDNFERFFSNDFYIYYSDPVQKKNGVVLLIARSLPCQEMRVLDEIPGRFLAVGMKSGDRKYLVGGWHAPAVSPKERSCFFKKIYSKTTTLYSQHQFDEMIFGGDSNCIECLDRDRLIKSDNRAVLGGYKELGNILRTNHMVDLYRLIFPLGQGFTHVSKCRGQIVNNYRLDHLFGTPGVANGTFQAEVVPCSFSDHEMVRIKMRSSVFGYEIGPGYWKANLSVIGTKWAKDFSEKVLSDFMEQTENTIPEVIFARWEVVKKRIKSGLKDRAKIDSSILRVDMERLEKRKKVLEGGNIEELPSFCQKELDQIKLQLEKYKQNTISMALHRANKKEELTDTHTLLTAKRLEKKNGANKHLFGVNNSMGETVVEQDKMEEVYVEFFTEKYKSCPVDESKWDGFLKNVEGFCRRRPGNFLKPQLMKTKLQRQFYLLIGKNRQARAAYR